MLTVLLVSVILILVGIVALIISGAALLVSAVSALAWPLAIVILALIGFKIIKDHKPTK